MESSVSNKLEFIVSTEAVCIGVESVVGVVHSVMNEGYSRFLISFNRVVA